MSDLTKDQTDNVNATRRVVDDLMDAIKGCEKVVREIRKIEAHPARGGPSE